MRDHRDAATRGRPALLLVRSTVRNLQVPAALKDQFGRYGESHWGSVPNQFVWGRESMIQACASEKEQSWIHLTAY